MKCSKCKENEAIVWLVVNTTPDTVVEMALDLMDGVSRFNVSQQCHECLSKVIMIVVEMGTAFAISPIDQLKPVAVPYDRIYQEVEVTP